MPELSREDKIAAARKKLREFQAAKAKRQLDESYVNQTHGFNVSGTGDYQTNFLSQREDNHFILPVDNCQAIQLEQKEQYEHGFNLSHVNVSENYANTSIYQPQSPSSVVVPQNNDNAVISLTDYFNNSTAYSYHPSPLQSLPNNNDDNHFVPYSENGQGVVLHDLTIHSNLTDKHQFVASSPTSLSSAFEVPSGIINQSVSMTDNTEYLSYCMYNANNNNDSNNNNNMPANMEFDNQQSKLDPNDLTVFPTSCYHVSSASVNNVNNSNQANSTLGQSSYPQSGVEEEEEVVNNMPTAATEKLLQLTRQLDGILEESDRLTSSMHTSGATSPIMNEFTSNHELKNTRMSPSSSSSLLESYHHSESCRQYCHQTCESHDQLTKDYSHCSPNYLLSSESSQMSIGQNHLVRELEERNVELASMLEKRNRAYEHLKVKLDLMKDQYERRLTDLSSERANLQNISQRDLEKTKEQIKAHAKTIGILVAEKTELQSQVTHLDNLAGQRLREIEEVNSKLKASRQQILDLERNLSESNATVNSLQTGNNDLQNQIKCLQKKIKHEVISRRDLECELAETNSRLTAKSCELAQTGISLKELKQQLEFSQIYANQLLNTTDSLVCSEDKKYSEEKEEWLSERADLQNRLKVLELSLSLMDTEKKQLDSQYHNYVAQVEQEANDLRCQLSETNKLKQEMELSLESVSRQLREKDNEISDLTCRLNSIQIIPTPLTVQSKPLTSSSVEEQDVNSTVVDQQLLEQIEMLETQLKSRTEELENANVEVRRLTVQLSTFEETVEQLQNSLADRDVVLATATSERSALSRAVEQNKNLKQQLSDLQTAYTHMCNNYQSKIKSSNEMNYALSKQIEHLNILQMENQNQSENIISCTILSIDNATQTDNSPVVHDQHLTVIDCTVTQSSSLPPPSTRPQQQQTDNMVKEQNTNLSQLTDEIVLLRNLFRRVSVMCQWFEHENGKINEPDKLNDPVSCVNLLEESIRKLVGKYSSNVIDNAVQCSMCMEQNESTSYVEELQNLQVAHTQLEAKFLKCMEELSSIKEERCTLERVNAQLEMEAATIEEYVILFTHRRAAAAKRAKIRELLLQRLVEDRKRLRDRLEKLFSQINPVYIENGQTELAKQQADTIPNDLNYLGGRFLNEFRSLIEEIELSTDEKEFEAGVSDLNDEDIGSEMENLNDNKLVFDLSTNDGIEKHHISHLTLENLRYQALRHDCPHCKCCVGTLLEV
uniref:Golgin subfamily A member 2 n=1 Tax=Schistosoma mansoni TaxID=6183 RepID=A0A3Q0KLJ2_SCHMA